MKSVFRPFLLISALVVFLNWQNLSLPEVASEQSNRKTYFEIAKIFENGETDSLGKYISKNYIDHSEPFPGVTSKGLQQVKDNITAFKAMFPDVKMKTHHVAADGDLLMVHGSWKGINTGSTKELPATGKTVEVEFVDILRFEGGKSAEHWQVIDQLGLMAQLGVLPRFPEAPSAINLPTYNWSAEVPVNATREAALKKNYLALLKMIESENPKLDKFLAKDIKENIKIPDVTLPKGIEGSMKLITQLKLAYPDVKFTVNHMTVEGDVLIAHITVEGTFSGVAAGYPATAKGKKVKVDAVDILQFSQEDKAIAHWGFMDRIEEMKQLEILSSK